MARKSRKINSVNNGNSINPAATDIHIPEKSLLRTAAYCRLSVENSGNETEETLVTQEKMVRDFIKSHPDLEWKDSYIDNGFTGTNFDRPEFNRMMEDVRRGEIQCVVVKDLSRFGRDYLETGHYLETIFPKLNVRFISITDDFDNMREKDVDSLSIPIKNLINAVYAKDISKKVASANEARILNGEIMGAFPPYGYLLSEDKKKYVVDESTARIVQLIFFWFIHGTNKYEISRRLNFVGIPTPRERQRLISDGKNFNDGKGQEWQASGIVRILKNPVYVGDLATGRTKRALYKGEKYSRRPEDEWHVTENTHEPLISREDFERARKLMENSKNEWDISLEKRNDERKLVPGYFNKMLYCKHCGKLMTIDRRAHSDDEYTYATYRCASNRMRKGCEFSFVYENYLLIIVMDQIRNLIRQLCEKKKLAEEIASENDSDAKIDSLKKSIGGTRYQLAEANGKKAKLYEDLADGILSKEDYLLMKEHFIEKEHELQKKLQQTELKYSQLVSQAKQYLDRVISIEKYISDSENTEQLIREFVDRIYVSDEKKIEIVFKGEDLYRHFSELYEEADNGIS